MPDKIVVITEDGDVRIQSDEHTKASLEKFMSESRSTMDEEDVSFINCFRVVFNIINL